MGFRADTASWAVSKSAFFSLLVLTRNGAPLTGETILDYHSLSARKISLKNRFPGKEMHGAPRSKE